MSLVRILACTFLAAHLVMAAYPASSQSPDPHVAAVLAQMDAASEHFKNARAEFSWDYYEAVVKDTSTLR